MKANQRLIEGDEAVSPVIAVILMVAITVVLAATVYIWVTSFSSSQNQGTTATVQATALDRDGNSKTDMIRLLLSNAQTAPFAGTTVTITLNGTTLDNSNTSFQPSPASIVYDTTNAPGRVICSSQLAGSATNASCTTTGLFGPSTNGQWNNGGGLYVDCKGGQNALVVSLRTSVVLSQSLNCDE